MSKATWKGSLRKGEGTMNLGSYNEDISYNFSSRFENGQGSNPEELLGAAHAACFSMALSGLLEEKGYETRSINTIAEVNIEKQNNGFRIIESNLSTEADVPNIEEALFMKLAVEAKVHCPISLALGKEVRKNLHASLI
jgi:osmotically inducible protein OsmC